MIKSVIVDDPTQGKLKRTKRRRNLRIGLKLIKDYRQNFLDNPNFA